MKQDWFNNLTDTTSAKLELLTAVEDNEKDGECLRESIAPQKGQRYWLDISQIEKSPMVLGTGESARKVRFFSVSGIMLQKFARSRFEPKSWAESRADEDVITLSGGGKGGLKQMLQLLEHFGGRVEVECVDSKRTENDNDQTISLGLFKVIDPAPAKSAPKAK